MRHSYFFANLSMALLIACTANAVNSDVSNGENPFILTQRNIVSIDPSKDKMPEAYDYLVKHGQVKFESGKDKIRAAFDHDGGQFQVLIPKEMFPIPAPHCQKNVILRMPGTDRDAPGSDRKLDIRWRLFQSLYAVKEGRMASIEVPLEIKHAPGFAPYMHIDKKGNPTLEWCNAYVNAKAMESKSRKPDP